MLMFAATTNRNRKTNLNFLLVLTTYKSINWIQISKTLIMSSIDDDKFLVPSVPRTGKLKLILKPKGKGNFTLVTKKNKKRKKKDKSRDEKKSKHSKHKLRQHKRLHKEHKASGSQSVESSSRALNSSNLQSKGHSTQSKGHSTQSKGHSIQSKGDSTQSKGDSTQSNSAPKPKLKECSYEKKEILSERELFKILEDEVRKAKTSLQIEYLVSQFCMQTRSITKADNAAKAEQLKRREEQLKIREEMLIHIRKVAADPTIFSEAQLVEDNNVDIYARMQESSGAQQLHVINCPPSGTISDDMLILLLAIRNIFSVVLTEMDRSYITKYVFDPFHRNLILIENGLVIGGINFRMFPAQDFAEIVFVAVSYGRDSHGYGTHMMNHLKDYNIKYEVHHLVTYAAVEACGFFEKQGFNEYPLHIVGKFDKSRYSNYIKHYAGAILMECKLETRIAYTEARDIISRQKRFLRRMIRDSVKARRAKARAEEKLKKKKLLEESKKGEL